MQARIIPAGDAAWLVELPERIDVEVNARAIDIAAGVERARLAAVTDVVVGYRTVMVYVDPTCHGAERVRAVLDAVVQTEQSGEARPVRVVDVPICYGGSYGPDLEDVAAFANCTAGDVISRHLAVEYRVFMVGFVPGFAYMAAVDPSIAAPRRPSPRTAVPAGSIGIAGLQTGIYPASTPGGWNLIGRCPVRPYAPGRDEPFLFRAGDRVCFRAISAEEYRETSEWEDA